MCEILAQTKLLVKKIGALGSGSARSERFPEKGEPWSPPSPSPFFDSTS